VIPGVRQEAGPGGLPFLLVETDGCRARLTPYGAHVCEWTPAGQTSSVLFLSPRAIFAPGSAIRGGVPVCFPWFAAHATDARKPAHGFARTTLWRMGDVTREPSGDVTITFHLTADAGTRALWTTDFAASLTVSLGTTLSMTFEVENRSATATTCEMALHTYLTVGDAAETTVSGLEPTRYLDKVDGMREKEPSGAPVTFTGEVDRIYVDTTAACTIEDPILSRKIRIEKSGSLTTVVWNPGPEKGPAVRDLGDAWRNFVCVETAACRPRAVDLAPRARHKMGAVISVFS
jgi:D-hexose-6-phosphate mutarotase